MVSNLRRRIEAIEELTRPKVFVDDAVQDAVILAVLGRISDGHRKALISALDAAIAGRPLTDREAAAQRAFDYLYAQEFKAYVQADPVTEFERLYGTQESGPVVLLC